MEWVNGETKTSKDKRKESWHKWFAWYPVIIGSIQIDGKERYIKAWLQYVSRLGRYGNFSGRWYFTYRSPDKTIEELNLND